MSSRRKCFQSMIIDQISLLCSQYLARTLQPNNPSHNLVSSSSGIRLMKHTIHSRFLHDVATYLSAAFCPPLNLRPPPTPFIPKRFRSRNLPQLLTVYFRLFFSQISAEETNLLRPCRTSLSQLCSFFRSLLHSYREMVGLITSPVCPSHKKGRRD